MMFGFVSYADAEPGYGPQRGVGFLDPERRGRGDFDPERMKTLLEERFGLDRDTMSEEERQEVIRRFRARRGGATESAAVGTGSDGAPGSR